MIAAVALAAAALAALPEGTARYRAELAGEVLGFAELRIACSGHACAASYESQLRAPADAGGAVERKGVTVEVDRSGWFQGGAVHVTRGGAREAVRGMPGSVPASLVEVVLASSPRPSLCVPFFREGRPGGAFACGRREGGAIVADLDGVGARIVPGADGFPAELLVAGSFRFVRDAAAQVPARAPRLAGTRVPGPSDAGAARAFCGVPRDPEAPSPPPPVAALPPPRAAGESCRDKTTAWLAAARLRGLEGRTAVGVAWDGSAFVWHAWAEVLASGVWVAVDPSFEQLPARGPRFTLGRFAPSDDVAREAAGARILACWGTARVDGPSAIPPAGPGTGRAPGPSGRAR